MVLILKDRVIKVPNPFNGWIPFFQGFISNHIEGCTWFGEVAEHDKLCPVLKFDLNGFWLVMKRADLVFYDWSDEDKARITEEFKDITLDGKPENFGFLDGRLVCIDYG